MLYLIIKYFCIKFHVWIKNSDDALLCNEHSHVSLILLSMYIIEPYVMR